MSQINCKVVENTHEVLDDDDKLSVIQPTERDIYTKILNFAETFSSTRLGQYVITQGDRLLCSVETTAKWFLPVEDNKTPVVRPLPWIPFLMLLVSLRIMRFWLSLGAILIGNNPITPYDTVYFIQTRRRKLRSIRLHGLRALKQRQNKDKTRTLLHNITKALLSAFCCSNRRQNNMNTNILLLREHWCSEHAKMQKITNCESNKRTVGQHDDDLEDQNLSFEEKLAKYANEPSDEDSDFVPDLEESEDNSSTSSDSDIISIDDEDELTVSDN